MIPFFAVVQVLISAALVTLVLMHSGREAGFGGMGFTPQSQGGTHIVERNLTRLTTADGGALLPEHRSSCTGCSRKTSLPATIAPRAGGGIGRRARLRALWGQPRGGSSPLQRMTARPRDGARARCGLLARSAARSETAPGPPLTLVREEPYSSSRTRVRTPHPRRPHAHRTATGDLAVSRRIHGRSRLPADRAGDR